MGNVLYPEIEPYDEGLLEVTAGNRVHYECCGKPRGKAAVVLHGGPGSGCTPGMRRLFDPERYRIVLFDQRQCGRSTPHASDPEVDLSSNTTRDLISDIETLRDYLAIDRWLVFGGSWGSVLALAYALEHSGRVSEMVLTGVATGRRSETDLLTRGLGTLFPEAWGKFRDGVPEGDRQGDLASAYARLLCDPDPEVRAKAARDWCDWEIAIEPSELEPNPRYDDPSFRMAFARIVTHYWSHGSWLEESELLNNAGLLSGIAGVLVQGCLDLGNLLGTAWELNRAWTSSELVLVQEAGHTARHPALLEAIVSATDSFSGPSG